MNNNVLFTLMLIVFISYVGFIWIRYGVQKSISDSYYRLPQGYKFLFTLFTWGFAYPAAILASNVWITPAAMLICLVGVARDFKNIKVLKFFHMFAAYTGVVLSQIGIWIYYDMWYLTIGFIILSGTLFLLNTKNKIWYIELLAFGSICVVLGLNL
jgi:hypothetical protein